LFRKKKIILFIIVFTVISLISIKLLGRIFQQDNIQQILDQKLDGKLVPHEVNHHTKLNDILKHGLRSLEIDLHFHTDQNNTSYFQIGHDKKDLNKLTFESYLKILKHKNIKKIWLDIKNVTNENIDQILKHLIYLDTIYHIKSSIIFESSLRSPQLKKISDSGFHTSYYLFNNPIEHMLSESRDEALRKEAKKIKLQLEEQNMKAISFNSMLYPFIKKYLEPLLSKEIVYHTWKSGKLKNYNVIKKIKTEKYFQDKRVKTILYYYYDKE